MPVMTEQSFNLILKSLSFPIYVFQRTKTGYTCDKLTVKDKDKKEFDRARYIITGRNQCSCIGWMKKRGCKHVNMLEEEHDGTVTVDVIKAEAEMLMEVLKGISADEVLSDGSGEGEKWSMLKAVVIIKNPPAERIAYIRHEGGGSMLVVIKFMKE